MMHRRFKMQIIDSLLQSEEFLPYISICDGLFTVSILPGSRENENT